MQKSEKGKGMEGKTVARKTERVEEHVYVEPKNLPSLLQLNAQVKEFEESCTWWQRYGADWTQFIVAFCLLPLALFILRRDALGCQALGLALLCAYHTCLTARAGHLALHGALTPYPRLSYAVTVFLTEFIASFSTRCSHDIHIKMHHPHTNIIGLGDSSSWKVPQLPCYVYMFLAPLSLPALVPLSALHQLIGARDWKHLAVFLVLAPAGILLHVALLVGVAGYTAGGALVALYVYRMGLAVPYIHINIFQHIGLPMYAPEDRPVRLYQMSTGCLNLSPNPLFNFVFGHSLISCHVEHHLFPRFSDNMCMLVRPLVRHFLRAHGLPYNEQSYRERLAFFLSDFNKLMVDAPAITHFMGIQ